MQSILDSIVHNGVAFGFGRRCRTKAGEVKGCGVSAKAKEAIEKAGGSIE